MPIAKLPIELLRNILDHSTDNPLRHDKSHSIPTFSTADRENEIDEKLRSIFTLEGKLKRLGQKSDDLAEDAENHVNYIESVEIEKRNKLN